MPNIYQLLYNTQVEREVKNILAGLKRNVNINTFLYLIGKSLIF